MELRNVAGEADYSAVAAEFAAEVASRWDSDRLRDAVMVTQKTRRALHASMAAGSGQHWDYNPPRDASQEYVRNHMDWTVAAGRYRFPPADE